MWRRQGSLQKVGKGSQSKKYSSRWRRETQEPSKDYNPHKSLRFCPTGTAGSLIGCLDDRMTLVVKDPSLGTTHFSAS